MAPANYVDWKGRARSFEEMGAVEETGYRITGDGPPELVRGAVVTAGVFRALGTQPLLGRIFRDDEDRREAPRVAIIGESLWRRRFAGDPGVIGKQIRLGDDNYTLVGVLGAGTEPPTEYSGIVGEAWTPLGRAYSLQEMSDRGRHNWMVVARLRAGVTRAQADAEMRSIGENLAREYPQTNEKVGAFVGPLRDHFVRGSMRVVLLLAGTVAFVLLIACSNLASLLLSRAANRSKEVGVRAALGAGVWQVARQFLCEGLLLSAMGSALGLVLATATFRFLAHLAPGAITGMKDLSIDWRVLAFTMALAVAVAIVFSLIPLLQIRRLDLIHSLKQNARTLAAASGSKRTKAILIGCEVALAFLLAIGAALLLQTFAKVRGVEPGFRTRNILTVQVPRFFEKNPTPAGIARWQGDLTRRVESIPGVVSAAVTNHIPILFKGDISGVTTDGRSEGNRVQCQARAAGPGYFRTMGIPVLRGREITESDRDGTPLVVMVNEALARELWPGQDPIGRSVVFEAKVAAAVIGVIRDIHQEALDSAPSPEFYISSLQAGFHSGSLVIHTKVDPASIAGAVRQAVWSIDPEQPVADVFTMEEILDWEVSQRRVQATLLAAFAGLAVLLAAVGLYGVLAYAVGQQLPEIGVRMALGAAPRDILGGILGRGLALAGAGLVAGVAGALALSKLLASFLFGVQPTDPSTYVAVASVLLIAAALASYLPARRAMRVDPVVALREE